MGKELLAFIDNVDYFRIIIVSFKDKKRKLTYGTNNRLFVNLNLNNTNALSEHIQINVCCLPECNVWKAREQISITCTPICVCNNEDKSACAMDIIITATIVLQIFVLLTAHLNIILVSNQFNAQNLILR